MKKKRNHPLRFIINKNNPHLLHIPFTSFFFIFTPTCYLLPPSPTGFPLGNVLSVSPPGIFVVYYESIKRELKIRCIYECRCDERLQPKIKTVFFIIIYYESTKRIKTKYISECLCYERLQTKTKEFTSLSCTEFFSCIMNQQSES